MVAAVVGASPLFRVTFCRPQSRVVGGWRLPKAWRRPTTAASFQHQMLMRPRSHDSLRAALLAVSSRTAGAQRSGTRLVRRAPWLMKD